MFRRTTYNIKKSVVSMVLRCKHCIGFLLILSLYVFSACRGVVRDHEGALLISGPLQGQKGRIAFSSGKDIWIINADGTGLTKLVEGGGPSWSPDGQQIVFTQGHLGANVYTMNADGSNVTQRTTTGGIAMAWSPDGRLISYTSGEMGKENLMIMEASGHGQRQLADVGGYWHDWSFDSSCIAFRCQNIKICIIDAHGSSLKLLTTQRAGNFDWSPNKLQIVFAGWDGGIYVVNWDGSGLKRIAQPARDETDPVWSPDGTKIAFVGKDPNLFDPHDPTGSGLYIMNSDGSAVKRLTKRQDVEVVGKPSWSPDGLAIAFTGRPTGKPGDNTNIYIVKTDGSAMVQLVKDATRPVWQPDNISSP